MMIIYITYNEGKVRLHATAESYPIRNGITGNKTTGEEENAI